MRAASTSVDSDEPIKRANASERGPQHDRGENECDCFLMLGTYELAFSGDRAQLLEKYTTEDRSIGSLVGVRYAEALNARSPLLVTDPEVFARSRFG